ncbi:MAG: hypothetical protein HY719_07645 [Planctomycetes bacterium]|nr:hypothetical protein [Planctomycetota bacterium]
MGKSAKELEQELAALRSENDHLKNKLRILGAGVGGSMFSVSAAKPQMMSIQGLGEAYLTVDKGGKIRSLNSKMAELFGFDKAEMIDHPLADFDKQLSFAPNIFSTLFRDARDQRQAVELEQNYTDTVSGQKKNLLLVATWDEKSGGTMVVRDETRLKQVRETFSRYVSPKVVERMQSTDVDFFRTERRVMSVLFADLRGFTSMCTGLTPDEVKQTINEYLTEAIAAVDQWEATVDKIVGDEVMALFGAPLPDPSHAYRAIRVAVDIQGRLSALIKRWRSENRPAPPVGIGINSGEMVVGNIGCARMVNYTVLGHHVNLAARLCAGAEGGEILVTRATIDCLLQFSREHPDQFQTPLKFRKAGTITAKGIAEPVEVIRVVF